MQESGSSINQYRGKKVEDYFNIVRGNSHDDNHRAGGIDSVVFDYLKSKLGDVRGKRVLDIGCGDGRWSEYIINKRAEAVIGIDVSEDMIGRALARKHKNKLTHANFITADVRSMPFENNAFDFALSMFSMMYFQDLSSVISEINRVLKKDSNFFIATNIFDTKKSENQKLCGIDVPIELGLDNKLRVVNVLQTRNMYIDSFAQNGFTLYNEKHFPSEGVNVADDFLYKEVVVLKKAVFLLTKHSEINTV